MDAAAPCLGSSFDPVRALELELVSGAPSLAVALHRIVLTERMAFPVLRHQQPPQIRMPRKSNPKQIENLALKIIRSRPERRQGLDRRTGAIEPNLQSHPLLLRNGQQMINQLKPGFGRIPIHACDIGKKIERALRVIAQKCARLADT